MSDIQYAIRQDGMFVAKVIAGEKDSPKAWREALHYLAVYRQDGHAEMWRRARNRHWKVVDNGADRTAVNMPGA